MKKELPKRPEQPNYRRILERELKKIGEFSFEENVAKRIRLEKQWDKNQQKGIPYKTQHQHDAYVDAFEMNS